MLFEEIEEEKKGGRGLKNIEILELSIVPAAANKTQFFFRKEDPMNLKDTLLAFDFNEDEAGEIIKKAEKTPDKAQEVLKNFVEKVKPHFDDMDADTQKSTRNAIRLMADQSNPVKKSKKIGGDFPKLTKALFPGYYEREMLKAAGELDEFGLTKSEQVEAVEEHLEKLKEKREEIRKSAEKSPGITQVFYHFQGGTQAVLEEIDGEIERAETILQDLKEE